MWYYELVGLRFPTLDELHKAIDLLADPQLTGMPVQPPGQRTLLVPKVALPVFKGAGLRFTEDPVENPSGKVI